VSIISFFVKFGLPSRETENSLEIELFWQKAQEKLHPKVPRLKIELPG